MMIDLNKTVCRLVQNYLASKRHFGQTATADAQEHHAQPHTCAAQCSTVCWLPPTAGHRPHDVVGDENQHFNIVAFLQQRHFRGIIPTSTCSVVSWRFSVTTSSSEAPTAADSSTVVRECVHGYVHACVHVCVHALPSSS